MKKDKKQKNKNKVAALNNLCMAHTGNQSFSFFNIEFLGSDKSSRIQVI